MGAPPKNPEQLNKVVVAFLNGGRIKGYASDFSPINDHFNLLPQDNPNQGEAVRVELKDLKAVFFVWDFAGHADYHESLSADSSMHGRRIEVTFNDGEKLVARTEGYNAQKLGFFMFPVDPRSNNIRIFVITKNARHVRLLSGGL